jgi:alkylation response protein AidB-like acyl-CoA dehydrogenase
MVTGIRSATGIGDWAEAIDRVIAVYEQDPDEGETARRMPQRVVDAIRTEGLLKLWTPGEYGGSEVDLPTFMEVAERLARADAATGWTCTILAAGTLMAAYLPSEGASRVFADGPNIGIPGAVAPRGRLMPVEGGYKVTGRWPLGSGSHYGDWIGCSGIVFDGEAPRMGPAGPDIRSIFVRPEDCELIDTWDSMGLRGTGSVDIVVNDVFVPEEMQFGLFTTPPQVSGTVYKAGPLALFSLAVSALLPGIARHAIDSFVALAMEKTPTLSQTGLATRPTIHAAVAHAEAQVQSSRAYLYEVAREVMTSLGTEPVIPDDIEAKRRLACVNVAEACRSAVESMYALAGSTPVYRGHALERCLRDIQTACQHLIVSPVWWEKTGQYYFGQGLGMP